ncbi:hypothetical protein QR46_0637 [Giardia duodenalis assemblage B]|uniref:Uncharacterized protein n=3 Tax=Giardia intestinalis TaxID=5741 RepID=A0A132NZ26_GIAIN|nr:Hypothetical protein GL50581_2219 [Giardia intestinalis ATCC 50581]ESU45436.1 Hypothetical protein GSB_150903 [Giardia intestinalis]KWX15315.1 hypothetical protein QR46_0637 [Giardia intestinalis assemblage B]
MKYRSRTHDLIMEMCRNSSEFDDSLMRADEALFIWRCRVCGGSIKSKRVCPSCSMVHCSSCSEGCIVCFQRVCLLCSFLSKDGYCCLDCYNSKIDYIKKRD